MTRSSTKAAVLLALALALASYVAWAQIGSKGGSRAAPTGSCTITLPDDTQTCTDGLTRDACGKAAQDAGGTADWVEGGSCG